MIVEDFRAGAAGAGIAHRPEVVALVALATGLVADAGDAFAGHANLVGPHLIGLVVGFVDGHPQLVGRQLEHAGEEFPGKADGVGLEVVTEAEVAQHFKEGVMAGGVADVFQVVVLAAGAHAALGGGGALIGARVAAGEDVLELHHARIGEQQRVVVDRDQWAAGDHLMAVVTEIVQEEFAKVGAADHGRGSSRWMDAVQVRGSNRWRIWSRVKPCWRNNRVCWRRPAASTGIRAWKRLRCRVRRVRGQSFSSVASAC